MGGRSECAMTAKEVEMSKHSNYFVLLAFDWWLQYHPTG
jgi:hypothetical protein